MIASMIEDHNRIRALSAALRGFVMADGVQIGLCFATARWALTRELLRHMAMERRLLREHKLAQDNGPDSFEDRYRAHIARWTAGEIDTHWPDYCRDLGDILTTLDRRMAFEEREIYPRIERSAA